MHAPSLHTPRLTRFKKARPAHSAPQAETIEWLARMHAVAERLRAEEGTAFDEDAFQVRMRKLLTRCGCAPDKIGSRGYELAGGVDVAWNETRIYDAAGGPNGAGSRVRTEAYAGIAEEAMDRLYTDDDSPPRDLLHVTCTGYTSPSAAQRLVAKRGWGRDTRVTHAYHMGCYASLPAVRLARGLLAAEPGASARVDIVHNEVCTLHLQPGDHSPEQLVVQTLFADGHVRYSVSQGELAGPSLAVLAMREEVVPDSADAMQWAVSDHGMRMALARDVPQRIARAAREFVAALFSSAGADYVRDAPAAVFAIHPGGPKVIDVMQQALELSDAQVAASRSVLFRYGNMSSATLPHIWMDVLEAPEVQRGTPVVSLAFGPGLTISAAFMVKG